MRRPELRSTAMIVLATIMIVALVAVAVASAMDAQHKDHSR
jgi:hypothetical protein